MILIEWWNTGIALPKMVTRRHVPSFWLYVGVLYPDRHGLVYWISFIWGSSSYSRPVGLSKDRELEKLVKYNITIHHSTSQYIWITRCCQHNYRKTSNISQKSEIRNHLFNMYTYKKKINTWETNRWQGNRSIQLGIRMSTQTCMYTQTRHTYP